MARREHKTRESWLLAAAKKLEAVLAIHGAAMPDRYAVSCGFPKGVSGKYIGQCFSRDCTQDETVHIFVCPTLGDPEKILGVLLHEMIHAAVGVECGHRGAFRALARSVGLAGPMTATHVPKESDLHEVVGEISERLGPYPHSPLMKTAANRRPPAGGWVKFQSKNADDYILRVSPKALEEHGAPRDPWGDEMTRA